MLRFAFNAAWIVLVLGYATAAHAYTPKERLRVLDYYLLLQEKDPRVKDDPEVQTVIDALVHTYTLPGTHSVLEVRRYEDAIASYLGKQARDPKNESNRIVLEALKLGIQDLNRSHKFQSGAGSVAACVPSSSGSQPLGEEAGNCLAHAVRVASGPRLEEEAKKVDEVAQKERRAARLAQLEALESEVAQNWRQVKFESYGLKPALADGKKREQFRGLVVKAGALVGRPKHFVGYWNRADGDCGLHGMNQKRAEFVRRVAERIDTDLDLRNDLRFGTFQLCGRQLGEENEKCLAILDSESDAKNMGMFKTYLNTTLKQPSEYLDFAGGSTPVGTLVAAARVFGLNLRVWRPAVGNSSQTVGDRELHSSLEVKFGKPEDPYVDLIHEGVHFNLLVERDDVEGRISALEREKLYMK